MDPIRKVLHAYQIEAVTINNITERLYSVYDGQQVYALKKSRLTRREIGNFEHVYHQAYSQNLPGILSVYLTSDGNLYKEVDGVFYYLTPWLQIKKINQKQEFEVLYQTIGAIHAKTKQSSTNDIEKVKTRFITYHENCMKIKSSILSYVKEFEKSRYMSPFELLVCTHYRDLDFFSHELMKRIDYFLDELEEQASWNYSLCHGQLNNSHILYSYHTYLTNWEKAHRNNAVVDLALLFRDLVKYYDQPTEQLIDLFSIYSNENNLTNSELYLLCIYLLDQRKYIQIVEQYANKTSTASMIQQICDLQQAYRQLIFAMKWSEYVDKISVSISDDLES